MLIYTHRVCMIILWRFYCGSFVLFCFVFPSGPERDRGRFRYQKKASATCFPNLQLLSAGSPYVVGEKMPTFSVKYLLRRQSTRDCEQHSAIPLIKTGAFESSCEELSEVYFRFAQLWQDPFFFSKSPKIGSQVPAPYVSYTACLLYTSDAADE